MAPAHAKAGASAARSSKATKATGAAAGDAEGRGRRRQGERTEAKLLDAGMQVLGERGFHAARVDDIVRVADVSHGTFYLYFANKEDLFRALAVRCADAMTELAAALPPIDPGPAGLAELRSWLARFVALYRTYGVVIRAWMEDQVASRELARLGSRTFAAVVKVLVARLEEAGSVAPERAELSAAALLAMIERLTYFVTSRDLDADDEVVAGTLAVLVHRGFFAAPAPTGTSGRGPRRRR
ncbi:MAG: helix-turn-helix domain-containing protein [Acidimicrobiales bacterium]